MKDLLLRSKREIDALRRRNEILEAKVSTMELMACVLHTQPAYQREGAMQVDVAWELEKAADSLDEHLDNERAQLGIDGNAGFALIGPNLQEGEAEFVEFQGDSLDSKLLACKKALSKLRQRLNRPRLNFYFGESHPYGN